MMTELGFMPSSTQKATGAEYRSDAMNPALNLQGYAGILGPFGTMGSGGAPYVQPNTTSPIGAGIGGGLAGFGLGQSWNQANSGGSGNMNTQPAVAGDANYPAAQYPEAGGSSWGIPNFGGGYSGVGGGAFGY